MNSKNFRRWVILTGLFAAHAGGSAQAAGQSGPNLFRQENLLAWCIVPFDVVKRGPAERVAMLKRLGFTQYVWDWRDEHLAGFAEEMQLARENDIRLRAVWLWIDRNADSVGNLGHGNRFILDAVGAAGLKVEYWVGFHENYFEGLPPEASVPRAAAMIAYLRDEAARSGCTVALYNHGGWFGEPENEIAIVEAVGQPYVGMVFNFHHAHDMIDRFPELLPRMLPYLKAVNLNGMIPEGPKIVPLGQGTHERAMLRVLVDSGYQGPIGILGHVDDADVEVILRRNLEGLRSLAAGL